MNSLTSLLQWKIRRLYTSRQHETHLWETCRVLTLSKVWRNPVNFFNMRIFISDPCCVGEKTLTHKHDASPLSLCQIKEAARMKLIQTSKLFEGVWWLTKPENSQKRMIGFIKKTTNVRSKINKRSDSPLCSKRLKWRHKTMVQAQNYENYLVAGHIKSGIFLVSVSKRTKNPLFLWVKNSKRYRSKRHFRQWFSR